MLLESFRQTSSEHPESRQFLTDNIVQVLTDATLFFGSDRQQLSLKRLRSETLRCTPAK